MLLFSQNPNDINCMFLHSHQCCSTRLGLLRLLQSQYQYPRFQLWHRRAGASACAPVEIVYNPAGRWAAQAEWAPCVPRAPSIRRHSHSPLLPAQYRHHEPLIRLNFQHIACKGISLFQSLALLTPLALLSDRAKGDTELNQSERHKEYAVNPKPDASP